MKYAPKISDLKQADTYEEQLDIAKDLREYATMIYEFEPTWIISDKLDEWRKASDEELKTLIKKYI